MTGAPPVPFLRVITLLYLSFASSDKSDHRLQCRTLVTYTLDIRPAICITTSTCSFHIGLIVLFILCLRISYQVVRNKHHEPSICRRDNGARDVSPVIVV